eukprot:jgi/Mesen1/10929/ME000095S10265
MASHVVGYPRIGPKRELKFAQEAFWDGKLSATELVSTAKELRASVWKQMQKAGVSFIPSNSFSFYDQVLDTTAMVGAVPARYGWKEGTAINLGIYFAMARGNSAQPAMEMTKWFDTNYHYIVPELGPDVKFQLSTHKALEEYEEAKAAGIETVPVLVGPLTYLYLAKPAKGVARDFDCLSLLPKLVPIYQQVIAELTAAGARWIQIDEPALVMDLSARHLAAFETVYNNFRPASSQSKLLLQTYFADIPPETYKLIADSPAFGGLGVDLVRGVNILNLVKSAGLPAGKVLFAGVVDGRNVWANDLEASLELLQSLQNHLGEDRVVVSTSCSLQHTAVNLATEAVGAKATLDQELLTWMAFAAQKVEEVVVLARALAGTKNEKEFSARSAALAARKASSRVYNPAVRAAVQKLNAFSDRRATPVGQRLAKQQEKLKLPPFPTTTIGSFPQTPEIRRVRREFKSKTISETEYVKAIQEEVARVVKLQIELDLDVLVHGEPERNDMVEYFGEQLQGFAFTSNGWVQSYGSRCVKPPVIFGDVSRPKAMTVEWTSFARDQAAGTRKPMKGMLTGPVTILNWSFVRNDQPRSETCQQIALAIRDEVRDLEAAGIEVLQIDEAALREGLPLRKEEQQHYLEWAVRSFRITTSVVRDDTQIHTHMCYSNFNDIMESIIAMDADVITIENSRSDEKLLSAFKEGGVLYAAGIGPGVYDIHSPRVPPTEEMAERIRKILGVLDAQVVWVNPDCGLKTRKYEQVMPALANMVQAAKLVRKELAARA